MTNPFALLIGWVLDLIFGDPQRLPHPVVGFGKMISWGEHRLNKGAHRKHRYFAPLRYVDLAQVENGQRDNQNQKGSAEICDFIGENRLTERCRTHRQHIAENGNRNQHKNQRDMHIVVLMPRQQIQNRQHNGHGQQNMIIHRNHVSLPKAEPSAR